MIIVPIEFHRTYHSLQEPEVYVVMHNKTKNPLGKVKWQFCLGCKVFPLMIVLATSIGIVFAILIALLVAAVVIVNINDYRMYQQYLANKKEAEVALQDMKNPLFVDPNKETQNPMYGDPNEDC